MNEKTRTIARATCAVALWLLATLPTFGAAQDKPDIFVQLGHGFLKQQWLRVTASLR